MTEPTTQPEPVDPGQDAGVDPPPDGELPNSPLDQEVPDAAGETVEPPVEGSQLDDSKTEAAARNGSSSAPGQPEDD